MIVSKLKQTGSQARRRHQWRVGSAEQPVNFRFGSEAAIRLPACERPFLARFGRLSLPFFSARQLTKKILGAPQTNSGLAGLLDLDNGLALGR
jgi:hypothetical protein